MELGLGLPEIRFFFDPIDKIIIREIPGKSKLKVAYTNKAYTVKNTAHIFIPNDEYDAKYLCAVLNSSLMGFYFTNKFSERDNVFPKVKIGQCRLLPIKMIGKNEQKPFIRLVDKLIKIKSANKDSSLLENQLDLSVYRLYGMNYDEVKLVDPDFDMSARDYNAYKID